MSIAIGLLGTTVNKKYRQQIDACMKTWVKIAENNNIPVIIFGGNHVDVEYKIVNFLNVGEDYNSAFQKQFLGLQYLRENHKSDFYFFGGTDNYINIENLKKIIAECNHKNDLYLGGHGDWRVINRENIYFLDGGAGFILSDVTLNKIFDNYPAENIEKWWKKICDPKYVKAMAPWCDVAIAYICHLLKIKYTINPNFYNCSYLGRVHNESRRCCEKPIPEKIISCHRMNFSAINEYHYQYLYPEDIAKSSYDNYTLVTFFSDFEERKLEYYLDKINFLKKLNINLTIYTEEKFTDFFTRMYDKIKVVNIKMEDLHLFNQEKKIVSNCLNNSKDFILGVSKYTLLKKTMEENWFNTDFFAWIDFGLIKNINPGLNQIRRALQFYREKVSLCCINYLPTELSKDYKKYVDYIKENKKIITTDFITGHQKYLKFVCDKFEDFFIKNLNAGSGYEEEFLFTEIFADHPEYFDLYYGDNEEIITNYDHQRLNPDLTIINVIIRARLDNNLKAGYKAGRKLLEDHQGEYLYLEDSEKLRLLHELFISSYYLDQKYCFDLLEEYKKFDINHTIDDLSINNVDFLKNNYLLGDVVEIISSSDKIIETEKIAQEYNKSIIYLIDAEKYTIKSLINFNPVIRPYKNRLNINYCKTINLVPV